MSIDNVLDISPRVQYTASASQTAFTYPFPIFADADLVVYDNDTLMVLTTDYTVSGEGDDNGGTVTFVSGRTAGHVITIYRDVATERTADFQQNGPLLSSSMNDEFDKVYLIAQELKATFDRAPLVDVTDDLDMSLGTAEDRASLVFGFDEQGEPTFLSPADIATTAAFISMRAETFVGDGVETVFTLGDAPGVVANCDVYIDGLRLVPTVDYTLSGTDITFATAPFDDAEILVSYGVSFPVGTVEYERTAAETSAGVTPDDYSISPGNYDRYPSSPTEAQLAAIAINDAYRESSTVFAVAIGGVQRAKFVSSGTDITELQLWSSASDDQGDVFIRFCENDGQTKGFVGFTAAGDDTFSLTSYEDFRMKFRTGDGTGNGFIGRAHIYGTGTTESWLAIESPRSDDIGGCFLRFVEDDPTVTKGYVGYSSTTTDDLYIINTETNRHVDVQTNGTGVLKSNPPLALTDGLTAPSALSGYALIYVDAADGDLKVKFPDGVTKTLATDT